MPSEERTSVVLTPEAKAIKDELSPAYGLKGLLSAALIEFAKRDPKDRETLVAKANKKQSKSDRQEEWVRQFILDRVAENPSEKERQLYEGLLRMLARSSTPKKGGRQAKS